jgi:insulin-like growth factor 2 mRNA-binding protein 1
MLSSVQEMASIYPDRVVAIRGTLDSMSRAENAISTKLRECYEKDTVNLHRVCLIL